MSAVPLKELGLGLGIEHLGDEQAQELTDDYSLPALKVTPEGGENQEGLEVAGNSRTKKFIETSHAVAAIYLIQLSAVSV